MNIVAAQVGRLRTAEDARCGIHIGAVGDRPPRMCAFDNGHHTIAADPCRHLQPCRAKPLRHHTCRAAFLARQLRMRMNVAAQRDQAAVQPRSGRIHRTLAQMGR
jgi:hypothetical protein